MLILVPDNYSRFEVLEAEQARQERIERQSQHEEDIRPEDLPFYYDYITIRETFGKGIKQCQPYTN